MIPVQFPEPDFKMKKEGEKHYIFDSIRKTWLLLTEEEWVRQNFIAYLVKKMNYPSSSIALEKEIQLNGLKKRFDILVYDSKHKPWMIVECKAPAVPLNEDVLQQALRYNISVPARFLVITNGNVTMGWEKEGNELKLLGGMPEVHY
ncbi:MAG TPA: type I restriction enzyme HsdR N-terminal domain-containing protein [Flavisolibacter sp.]|nr:type I restriction enzyme HsdR N-terminal domain-containing protein [Flavisolibacter sp.]